MLMASIHYDALARLSARLIHVESATNITHPLSLAADDIRSHNGLSHLHESKC